MKIFFACFSLMFLLFCTNAVVADQPLEAPADKTICSTNKRFCVVMDYEDKLTTAYRITKQGRKEKRAKLWEMPGWYYNALLANDGEHLVIGNDKRNLLDLDYKPDRVMLSFYRQGQLIQKVQLNQLVENLAEMRRTASHYAWCRMIGFDLNGNYSVTTYENREFIFDVTTGKPINIELLKPLPQANQTVTSATAEASQSLPAVEESRSVDNSSREQQNKSNYCFAAFVCFGVAVVIQTIVERKH